MRADRSGQLGRDWGQAGLAGGTKSLLFRVSVIDVRLSQSDRQTLNEISAEKKPVVVRPPLPAFQSEGDGTRTRDLQRDRLAL